MKYPNTENLNKAEQELINDLCPNEKAKFDDWFDELKSKYLHLLGYIDIRYWYDVFMSGADTDEAATKVKTPCVMKFKDDYLFYFDSMKHLNLTSMEIRVSGIESCDSNVTNQFLQNTWGVVESKEHAEFIIELAKLHGFGVWKAIKIERGYDIKMFFFCPTDNELQLYHNDVSPSMINGEKQITIPLPPKAKEWPQVGDEVEYRGAKFKVLMTADKSGHIVADDNGNYINPHIEDIKKPKSKQDLLIEGLQTKLCNNNAVDNYILACDIINGEIEGLSYEPKQTASN
jgi:hypothetical protein